MSSREGELLSVDWRVGDLEYHQETWTILSNDPVMSLAISSKADAGLLADEMLKLDGSGGLFRVRSKLAYAEFPVEGFAAAWQELVSKCQTLGG